MLMRGEREVARLAERARVAVRAGRRRPRQHLVLDGSPLVRLDERPAVLMLIGGGRVAEEQAARRRRAGDGGRRGGRRRAGRRRRRARRRAGRRAGRGRLARERLEARQAPRVPTVVALRGQQQRSAGPVSTLISH